MSAVDLQELAPERCARITRYGTPCTRRVSMAGKRLAAAGAAACQVLEWDDVPDDEIVWACAKHARKLSLDPALRWRRFRPLRAA